MNHLESIEKKIFSDIGSFMPLREIWGLQGDKVVFTNGCFDLLHRGHLVYLAKAASMGDRLVIGLNSDVSVKKLKGSGRPVVDEYSRALILAAFSFVSAVLLFDDETPRKVIAAVLPDFLIKGKDYTPDEIIGNEVVRSYGGRIETIELEPGFSTSALIEKIKSKEV